MIEYHAAYTPIGDGWYFAEVLDFPGVITQGKDLDDARYMVRDALKLMAECYLEDGKPLPKPRRRARRKKAKLVEPVYLTVRVTRGRQHEESKADQPSAECFATPSGGQAVCGAKDLQTIECASPKREVN